METRLLTLVMALMLAASVNAANYCVTESGSGAKNGADWNNAFEGLPQTLVRGSTYYIADGSYNGYTFDDSGTQLTSVKKATTQDHGTENGWQATMGDGQAVWNGQIAFESSYWVFDGVTGGGAGSWDKGFGFKIAVTADSDALIRVAYTSAAHDVTVSHVDMQGKGSVSNQGGSYSNDGLAIYNGASNVRLSYFWMHGIGRCPFFISTKDAILEYGWVQSFYGSSAVHSEVMSTYGIEGDVTFRYNLVTDSQSTGGLMWDSSSNPAAHFYVYGNVFYQPSGAQWSEANGVIGGWTGGNGEKCQNMMIYNNAFIGISYLPISSFPRIYGNNVVQNNLFYNCDSPDFSIIASHDYNHFINSGPQSELHGTTGSTDPFVDYVNLDFRLKAATSTGTALPSPFNADAYQNIRGADGTWDRGAYEFVSGSQVCTPDWKCTIWSDCANNQQTRTCTDSNACGTIVGKPETTQSCTSCTPTTEICGNGIDEDCDGLDKACPGDLITNGNFENGFTSGIGNGWLITSDGTTKYIPSEDTGYQGKGQKLQATAFGSWGYFIYQTPAFVSGKSYNLSFWYKTDTQLFAEVSDAQANNRIVQQTFPLTTQWKQASIQFTYTNQAANQLRFSIETVGTYWIDDVVLKESCAAADVDCDGCIEQGELLQYIQQWKTGTITLAQLMEVIRQWKQGC